MPPFVFEFYASDDLDDIITNQFTNTHQIVTIKPSDKGFENSCFCCSELIEVNRPYPAIRAAHQGVHRCRYGRAVREICSSAWVR